MSQVLCAAPQTLRDVEYAQAGGISLRFDASLPNEEHLSPAAILVHGGAWVRGDRHWNVEPLFEPLSSAGFAWFSISYRLASDPFQIGVAAADVAEAIRFVRSHAAEYHIDPNRIVLIGESAGGHLAALAALENSPETQVRAVVAFYTPTDLVALAKTSDLIPQSIRKQLNGSPFEKLIVARLSQLSPIQGVREGMPPFLFIHGDTDAIVPIDQSRAMCERMQSVGAACSLITVPGAGHGMRRWEDTPAQSRPYKKEMLLWLKEQVAEQRVFAL